jgi:glycine cleavage system aminomethyltransferase T
MNKQEMFMLNPSIPYEFDTVQLWAPFGGSVVVPFEYTGWRDETLAWKNSAYLGTALSLISPTFKIKGPDVMKFLSDHFVNSFAKFPVGGTKHGIMCNEEGLNMMDGIIIRTAEDEVMTYWLDPYISYCLQKGKYNATGENLSGGKVFFFQVAGPRSLEILEKASGDDLHDVKFFRHRMSRIAGKDVRILRMGMAGTLAYEVHGNMEDGQDVYKAIFGAGKEYGMKKLGQIAYMMNHTEDGFPQAYYHFPYPWNEDAGFSAYLHKAGIGFFVDNLRLVGSMGKDIKLRYRNPVELGWGDMIKFDHEFVGRAAVETMISNPKRKMVTLEWNGDDITDIYASQFRDETPYTQMDRPNDMYLVPGPMTYHADQVLKDGKVIGISSGRSISQFYHRMISLSSIDVEFSALGTDVIVLWGDPGTRQKQVRAKVAQFPYLQEERNSEIDVSKIPHGNR